MSLSYAACLKKGLEVEQPHVSNNIAHHTTSDHGTRATSSSPSYTVVGRIGYQSYTGHIKYAEDAKPFLTSRERSLFDRVLNDIQNELANIGPYAKASRLQVSQQGPEAEKSIRKAHQQEAQRIVRLQQRRFRLMDLPYHIRLRILDYAIDPMKERFFVRIEKRRKTRSIGAPTPALARVPNMRLRLESLLIALEKSNIIISDYNAEMRTGWWLRDIDFTRLQGDTRYETGFDAIKSLHIVDFVFYPVPPHPSEAPLVYIQLINKCKNLRVLTLEFLMKWLTKPNKDRNTPPHAQYVPKSITQLKRMCCLGTLVPQAKLDTLHLTARFKEYGHPDEKKAGHASLFALKVWFEKTFAERGLELEVFVPEGADSNPWM